MWCGWQRLPGQKWRLLVEDADSGQAWTRLLDTPYAGTRRDLFVCPAGVDPNDPPAWADPPAKRRRRPKCPSR